MMRRLHLLPLAVVAIAGVVGLIVIDPLARLGGGDPVDAVDVRDQDELIVATLSVTNDADGELGFAERRTVVAAQSGTVTSVRPADTPIVAGDALVHIDDQPMIALTGSTPAWRAMTVDDVGPDVAQLEAALIGLGYDPDGILTIDDTYTTTTATIVARWQEDAGLDATGTVEFGAVVFVPDDARIASVSTGVGQATSPGGELLVVSTNERVVEASVAADQRDTIDVGTTVAVTLPDRTTLDAVVDEIVASGDGSWSVTAAVSPTDGELPEGGTVPVTVAWTTVVADDVVTVQAGALTRLDTGAYVLEVVDEEGETGFVEVGIGSASGSTIEIVTDLPPGTAVISP